MKGVLILVVMIALLVGFYLVYHSLPEEGSDVDRAESIQAIKKGRRGVKIIEKELERIYNRAEEASE